MSFPIIEQATTCLRRSELAVPEPVLIASGATT